MQLCIDPLIAGKSGMGSLADDAANSGRMTVGMMGRMRSTYASEFVRWIGRA
jgi:hypothetical protein